MALEERDQHFDKTFGYIRMVTVIVLLYVAAVTFVPIPKESQRFVDISLAFLLGFLSSNSQYLTGGTPVTKKQEQITTTEVTTEGTKITTEPAQPKTETDDKS